jgi:hypothetical protein
LLTKRAGTRTFADTGGWQLFADTEGWHQNCPASKQSWKYVKYRNFRIAKPSAFKPLFPHEILCDASQCSLVRPSNVLRIVKQTLLVVIFLLALAHPVLHPVPRLVVILHGSYVIGWKEEDVAVD